MAARPARQQPDAGTPTEDCGTMRPDALWYDRECEMERHYVCEAS